MTTTATRTTTGTTTHGRFTILEGYEAGKLISDNLSIYMAKMSAASESTRSSTVDKIGAGAGVVGAICGVAGLGGGKQSTPSKIEMTFDNLSSYPLVPYKTDLSGCDLELAPRPMLSSDNTSLKVEVVNSDTLSINTRFYIGIALGIDIQLKMHRDNDGPTDMWQIYEAIIDGSTATGWPRGGAAQTLKFEATSSGYPSFCFHYFPVDIEGVASYLFCDYYSS